LIEYILGVKGEDVVTVAPDTSVQAAVELMRTNVIGIIVVCSYGGCIIGVLSERDCVRGIADHVNKLEEMTVDELMTPNPITCTPDTDPLDVMITMKNKGFRHMPVVSGDELVGLISITDLNKIILAEADVSEDWRNRLQRAGVV
jgi:CBS domain-containing protein